MKVRDASHHIITRAPGGRLIHMELDRISVKRFGWWALVIALKVGVVLGWVMRGMR